MKPTLTLEFKRDILLYYFGVNLETFNFATETYGVNDKAMSDLLYWICGYRDFEKLLATHELDDWMKRLFDVYELDDLLFI